MLMSWVALRNATTKALMASACKPRCGSCSDMAPIAINSPICVTSIQPRRRPRKGGT
jgi:hypothetical protein